MIFSDRERNDMQSMGVTSCRGVKVFKVAKILGVHFRSGEWGCRRCGSVMTTTVILIVYQRPTSCMSLFIMGQFISAAVIWLAPSFPATAHLVIMIARRP